MLESGLWTTSGKTPWATVNARISSDINSKGEQSRFCRDGPGVYGVNTPDSSAPISEPRNQPQAPQESKLSYTDAAEQILRQNDGQEPLHYREIARRMLGRGLVATKAVTPAHTLNARVGDEIRRRKESDQPQRFVRLGRGLIGLADAEPVGVRRAIDAENRRVRDALLDFLRRTDPVEFEHLVGELINAMGAESVEVTQRSSDGGVDVRGTLLAGGAIPIKIAAQVKRRSDNIGRPVVNELRGSLQSDETGLIVTTGGFTSSAKETAQDERLRAITLIDSNKLVELMVEHEIWVNRQQHDLLTLATPSPDRTKGSA